MLVTHVALGLSLGAYVTAGFVVSHKSKTNMTAEQHLGEKRYDMCDATENVALAPGTSKLQNV